VRRDKFTVLGDDVVEFVRREVKAIARA
jgi:hypothetical protein